MGAVRGVSPAVAIVGKSGSGKTVLIERLVQSFADKGYRVGTVKYHTKENFEIDYEGKDSWRHREAGSLHTVIAAPTKLASIRTLEHELEFDEIIKQMPGLDVVLVEGYRHAGLPSFEISREGNSRAEGFVPPLDDPDTVAVVTDSASLAAHAQELGLPTFDLDDVGGIREFIETHYL